jgi:hypothetical protein
LRRPPQTALMILKLTYVKDFKGLLCLGLILFAFEA